MDSRRVKARWLATVWTASALAAAASAQGQAITFIDPSVRASGMGAGNAVFWGASVNHWANPALLAYERGITFESMEAALAPGLANDVEYSRTVVSAGGAGIAIAFGGRPFAAGLGARLDYGTIDITDVEGNLIGTHRPSETARWWSVGLSVAEMLESVAGALGHDPLRVSRWVDLSLGRTHKRVEVDLAPVELLGAASTTARDEGFLVRATPVDGIASGLGPLPLRVALAYGWSRRNAGSPGLWFARDRHAPLAGERREGLGVRAGLGWPADLARAARSRGLSNLVAGLEPLISLGLAWDGNVWRSSDGKHTATGRGFEVTIANLVSVRGGRHEDRNADVDGTTSGWGLGLNCGPWGGVRYDVSRFPQARTLPDIERREFSARVDLAAIVTDATRRR